MNEIWFDSGVYELADRGLASGKRSVLELFVEHVEHGVEIPRDLLEATARIIRKEIPKIKSDKGVHDKSFSAWENAVSVKALLETDPHMTVENACFAVSQEVGLSFDAVTWHWKRFRTNPEFNHGEVPPLEMLGTIPGKGADQK